MRIIEYFKFLGSLTKPWRAGGGNSEMYKHPIQGEGGGYTSNDFMPQQLS